MADSRKNDPRKAEKFVRERLDKRAKGPLATNAVRPGYKGRWVRTWDGGFDEKLALGYQVVKEDRGKSDPEASSNNPFASAVTRIDKGTGKPLVLMEIPEDIYHEYKRIREAENRERAKTLEAEANANAENTYGDMKSSVTKGN